MSRQARLISQSGIYHVIQRGADRRIIFSDNYDCMEFLKILRKTKQETDFALYAYCLMSNHFHFLIKQNSDSLELIFKKISCSYVYYYNKKYELHGHLFQDRFKSEPVDCNEYFLDVLRYICQNPVKAGLCSVPDDYIWLGCSGITDSNGLLDPLYPYTNLRGQELKSFVQVPCNMAHIDAVGPKRLTDSEAVARLCESSGCTNVQEIAYWDPLCMEAAIIAGIKAGLSIRQIARLTAISKARIESILRKSS
ncbi:MAG: transposase [Lachnospiraceae bacterium]|nr:transposase [Lachnospiraceae bacterium]